MRKEESRCKYERGREIKIKKVCIRRKEGMDEDKRKKGRCNARFSFGLQPRHNKTRQSFNERMDERKTKK